jgi:two-component system alkaline phosphatase synthesis response regulator PhoP
MPPRILVVEDEAGLRLAVKDELEFEGFEVDIAENGTAALAAIRRSAPDLVVLDLMLPGQNGFQVCQTLRAEGIGTPIIIVTARDQEVDKVRGLELGADDYLTKPFGLAELVARIRAILRRVRKEKEDDGALIEVHPVKVDLRRHRAFKGEGELQLTDTEFRILALLLQRAGEVISRDDFLKHVWGEEVYVSHRTVDTHIATLRKKIEDDAENPVLICSVRNVGYRFRENTTNS